MTLPHQRSSNEPARPLVIEFAGTPSAGKTTALGGLATQLRARGYRVVVVKEQAREGNPVLDKHDVHFNLWTACATILEIIGALRSQVDVVLIDRGPFDHLAWAEWSRHCPDNPLPEHDREVFHDCLRTQTLSTMIDLVLVMTVDPSEAMRRDGRTDATPGRIVNDRSLTLFNQGVERVAERAREYHVERIDTTANDEAATLAQIFRIVAPHLPPVPVATP